METWVDIPDSRHYEVSDKGRVRNKNTGVILKPSLSRGGYEKVNLYYDRKQHSAKIHRLVANAFVQNSNSYNVVNHIDGDKSNNSSDNLEWCTSKDNNIHAFLHGLNYRPVNSGVPKRRVEIIEKGIIFDSVCECARFLETAPSNIFACLSGRCKTCKGYSFKYVDERR